MGKDRHTNQQLVAAEADLQKAKELYKAQRTPHGTPPPQVFLDPFDNENAGLRPFGISLNVGTLLQETNLGSTRWLRTAIALPAGDISSARHLALRRGAGAVFWRAGAVVARRRAQVSLAPVDGWLFRRHF